MDAGLHHPSRVWVVRRARIRVERFPSFDEPLSVETFCSGVGKLWAERRTTVHGEQGGCAEAVALWVYIDAESERPSAIGDEFLGVYGASADGRRVRARLRHSQPPADAPSRPWVFRAADLDMAGHVNNASYWEIVEEELIATPPSDLVDVEIEHRAPAGAGPVRVLRGDALRWVVGADEELHASIVLGSGLR